MSATLGHSPSEVVRQLLVDLGLGVDGTWAANEYTGAAWPVSAGGELDKPDNTITVYDTTGRGLGRGMAGGELNQNFGFQVRVRGTTHRVGWVKADSIQRTLAEGVSKRQVNVAADATTPAGRYLVWCVSQVGQVLPIGTEVPKSKRKLFTLNALVTIKQF